MRIKFRPTTKIKRLVDGKRVMVFSHRKVYEGELNIDRTVLGYCPRYDKHIKIGLNDYMIER